MQQTILVIDDEQGMRFMLKEMLTTAGYYVITADNSYDDALALAKSSHPDLIILDVLMPIMYGGEVAACLKEDPKTKDVPVIFLSCLYSNEDDFKKDSMIGSYAYVGKSCNMEEELLTKI